jgi:hypothetical protein
MCQCSFFLDNLVCLDSDHAVTYPRPQGSCFRGTPGPDTHSRLKKTKVSIESVEKVEIWIAHGQVPAYSTSTVAGYRVISIVLPS